MELHSILLLVSVLVIIASLTYFISVKQKKKLSHLNLKQEPRFDFAAKPAPLPEPIAEQEEESFEQEENTNANLLIDDPLVPPETTYIKKNHEPEQKKPKSSVDDVLYLIVKAKPNRPYVGYELLQAMLSSGLRYGVMNIFHRHEDANGNGKILFSVASAQEPGTFEINKMGAYSGNGLMMFLRFSSNKDVMSAFDIMLETAKQLVEDLDGDILDDERKVLSSEKIEKIRKRILEFEQKQITGDLFDQ